MNRVVIKKKMSIDQLNRVKNNQLLRINHPYSDMHITGKTVKILCFYVDKFSQHVPLQNGKFVQTLLPMELDFVKNIQFTKLAKVGGRLKEFNFRKPNSRHDGTFTVDVMDDNGNRIIFRMELHSNEWKIVSQQLLPHWVVESETTFNQMIYEEFKLN